MEQMRKGDSKADVNASKLNKDATSKPSEVKLVPKKHIIEEKVYIFSIFLSYNVLLFVFFVL